MPITSTGMHYEERGSGPVTVLMLPGLGCSIEAWARVTPLLEGFRFFLMDLPGHAGSRGAEADGSSLATISAPVVEACDELGLERFFVVGLSFGAAIGVRMAIDRPDQVLGVLACMPWNAGGADADDAFMPQVLASYGDVAGLTRLVEMISLDASQTTDTLHTMTTGVSEAFWKSWYGHGVYTSMAEELSGITVPVCYVLGSKDVVAPQPRLIDDVTRIPSGRLVLLSDVGHLAPYEHPALVAAEIRDFLARHTTGLAPS